MSDCCYMSVTCRKQDAKRFEDIGFEEIDEEETPKGILVEMEDEQANAAHYGKLPIDIPYYGFSGSGGDYGPSLFACDGKKYIEINCNEYREPMVPIMITRTEATIAADVMEDAREYGRLLATVQEILG